MPIGYIAAVVTRGSASFVARAPTVVVLGNFDGVHLGHQALLARARTMARPLGGVVVAYTFDPHPASVLAPERAPTTLLGLDQKVRWLEHYGADHVVVEPFTRAFAALGAEAFVRDVLVARLGAHGVAVGYDFTYGAARSGSTETLRNAGTALGFDVAIVEPVSLGGIAVSSSRIRQYLGRGELKEARACLGHDYEIAGTVVRGMQRGRTLGIPTANVATALPLLLPSGIYACTLRQAGDSHCHNGVASLGVNPTFGDLTARALEVHVLDWQGDLYDRPVEVVPLRRLRDEQAFVTVERLVAQIHRDIQESRALFAARPSDREFTP